MIFGDQETFAIEIRPVEPSWKRAGSDEGPWAGLLFWCEGRNLCECVMEGEDRRLDAIHVPLLPLTSWLVRNAKAILHEEYPAAFRMDAALHHALKRWNDSEPPNPADSGEFEDERFAWYERHFWLAGAEGCLVPDLAFARIDGRLALSWRQPRFAGPRRPRFVAASGEASLAWNAAWSALCEFVAHVAAHVRRTSLSGAPAWTADPDPLRGASACGAGEFLELAGLRQEEWIGALGIEPGSDPETSPSLLALRDLDAGPRGRADVLRALKVLGSAVPPAGLDDLLRRRESLRDASTANRPEHAGYEAAAWFRAEHGLDGQPLSTERLRGMIESAARLSTIETDCEANDSAAGIDAEGRAAAVLFRHPRTAKSWAERMELARILGHLLLDPESSRGAVGAGGSRRAVGPRRRRSGAFAVELLMPASGVRQSAGSSFPADPAAFAAVLSRFGVGARAAAYHLWNRGFLESENERDDLIENFAMREIPGAS